MGATVGVAMCVITAFAAVVAIAIVLLGGSL